MIAASPLLAALALFLALNPPYRRISLVARRRRRAVPAGLGPNPPGAGRESDEAPAAGGIAEPAVATRAGGAAVALAAVSAAAAASGPLLDVLDVGPATARIAAGLVLVASSAWVVAARPPRPVVVPAGRSAAAVPVAFPVLIRPEVVLVAVAAGADAGVAVAVASAVAGLAAFVVLPGRAGGDPAARFVAAAAVLVGVALVVAGVLDV